MKLDDYIKKRQLEKAKADALLLKNKGYSYEKAFEKLRYEKKVKKKALRKAGFRKQIKFPKLDSHVKIAVIMVIAFILAILVHIGVTYKTGQGDCPYVSSDDVRMANSLYLQNTGNFAPEIYKEFISAYHGSGDCTEISRDEVKELRKIFKS